MLNVSCFFQLLAHAGTCHHSFPFFNISHRSDAYLDMVAKDCGKRSVEQLDPSEQDAEEVMKFDASSCGKWSLQTDEKPSRFLSFDDNQVVTLGSASCNDVIISSSDSFVFPVSWLHLVIVPLPTTGVNCPLFKQCDAF